METLREHVSRELAWNLFLVAKKYIPQERMMDFIEETTAMIREAQRAIPLDCPDKSAAALEAAADAEDRSVSAQTERILRAWLVETGYLSA